MEFDRVTDRIGVEVRGIDLADLDEGDIAALDLALADHGVLFFRGQDITPDDHIAMGAAFGELHIHPYEHNLGGDHQAVIVLDSQNYRTKGRDPVPWHHDATFEPRPPRGSILRAIELPEVGGDTLWADMYAAYDGLSSKLQRIIDELDATHDATHIFSQRVADKRSRPDAETTMTASVHPVVATHPVSGRRALFVNANFTTGIVDMRPKESEALLAVLFATVQNPDIQVRLRWAPGTVAMWDNRCTQHYAVGGYTGRRVMQRVTFLGPPPAR